MRKIASTILIALTSFSFLSFAYSADEDTYELEEFENQELNFFICLSYVKIFQEKV